MGPISDRSNIFTTRFFQEAVKLNMKSISRFWAWFPWNSQANLPTYTTICARKTKMKINALIFPIARMIRVFLSQSLNALYGHFEKVGDWRTSTNSTEAFVSLASPQPVPKHCSPYSFAKRLMTRSTICFCPRRSTPWPSASYLTMH